MTTCNVDALLVTAIQTERSAVREHLAAIRREEIGSVALDIGDFEIEGGSIRVAVIEVGPGNIDAAVLTAITTIELQPAITMMVGIAGGVKDLRLGDVVASSKVYWIEPGKSLGDEVRVRPDLGAISPSLVQLARRVAADGYWQQRIRLTSPQPDAPVAIVAPIVAGERVVASSESQDAMKIRKGFSDAVAVAMEDFGVARAAAVAGASESIAIRAASDLLDDKSAADASGSQLVAAAHAAAFAFELLAQSRQAQPATSVPSTPGGLHAFVATLYPLGPSERNVWERAGGDLSTITLGGTGRSMWWTALRELGQGGGGSEISLRSLILVMLDDYPRNETLALIAQSD